MSTARQLFDSMSGYGGFAPTATPSSDPNYLQNLVQGGQIPNDMTAGGGISGWLKDNGVMNKMNADGTTEQGWGMPALAAGQGIFNAWMGMKQYGLYKDQLGESKRQFGLNYDAQKKTTNASLEDRQRARVASNAGAYQSVGDYMHANGIGG